MQNLPVSDLDFDSIKSNFKTYLKSTGKYNDIDFESSGIGTIINLLSYNTHYIGYYTKMLMNEAFVDSAVLRSSLLSKAKLTGYVPKSMKSATATIRVSLSLTSFERESLNGLSPIVSAGTKFTSQNELGNVIQFVTLKDTPFVFLGQSGINYSYECPYLIINEGALLTENFIVSKLSDRFIIRNNNIDIDTLRVYIKETPESIAKEYTQVNELFELDSTSEVYFLSTDESGYYEVIFGNNTFGKALSYNNEVILDFLSTSGLSGNNCNVFNKGTPDYNSPNDYSQFQSSFLISVEKSGGGLDFETEEDLRFNIPKANTRQHRLVTTSDFRSYLINEFRDIDSISVYGGENTYPKEYNKLFIAIKPKNSQRLSYFAKEEIRNKISNLKTVGLNIQFVDPKYININLEVFTKLITDNTKNPSETKNRIINIINDYNKLSLNRFDAFYSDIDLLLKIKTVLQSVFTIYTKKTIYKNFDIIHGNTNEQIIDFGKDNKITPNSLVSGKIYYNDQEAYIKDSSGKLYLYDSEGTLISSSIGTIDFNTSRIKLLPELSFRSDIKYSNYDTYKFYITPVSQDVFSFNDTIINLSSINVTLI